MGDRAATSSPLATRSDSLNRPQASPYADPLVRSWSDRGMRTSSRQSQAAQDCILSSPSHQHVTEQSGTPSPPAQSAVLISSPSQHGHMAEMGRLRAELLLAREDLLAERAARLRLEAVLVASQRYANRAPPQPSAQPSLLQSSPPGQDPTRQGIPHGAASLQQPLSGSTGRSSLRWHPDVESPSSSPPPQSRLGNAASSWLQASPQSESSFGGASGVDMSPMGSSPSGYWGRSSIAVQQEAASAVDQEPLVVAAGSWDNRRRADASAPAAGRSTMMSLLDSPSSFSGSFSSPYRTRDGGVASVQSRSKPGSPTKRSHASRADQPLRTSSKSLPGNASLDAGSWVYIMGTRANSIAAKQMARNGHSLQLLQ